MTPRRMKLVLPSGYTPWNHESTHRTKLSIHQRLIKGLDIDGKDFGKPWSVFMYVPDADLFFISLSVYVVVIIVKKADRLLL